jgi:hypothetical protein
MTQFFLKAKHWQLFVLMFAIPMAFQIIVMACVFSNIVAAAASGQEPNPFLVFGYMKWFPIVMVFYLAIHYGWFWAIVTGLQRFIPQEVKLKVTRFKVLLLIPIVYITVIMCLLGLVFANFNPEAMENGAMPDVSLFPIIIMIFIPLHFFAIFCIFHSMYFVAKTIKTAELQREVIFNDFVAEFFMLWFYFVGVWILQPRINKMVEQADATFQPKG